MVYDSTSRATTATKQDHSKRNNKTVSTYRSSKKSASGRDGVTGGDMDLTMGATQSAIMEDTENKQAAKEYNKDFADYMTSIVTKGGGSSALAQQMNATA